MCRLEFPHAQDAQGPPLISGLVWLKLTTLLLLSATVVTAGPPSGNAPQVGLLAVKMKTNAAAFAGGQQ